MTDDKSKWKKVLVVAGVLLLFTVLLFIIKKQHDLLIKQKEISDSISEMKRLSGDITRSETKYIEKKDLEDFAKKNKIDLSPIEDDLKQLKANLIGINHVLASTPGFYARNIPSSSTSTTNNKLPTIQCPDGNRVPCPDPYGYLTKSQHLSLFEPFNLQDPVPFGQVSFNSWLKNPWELKIYPRDYAVTTVLGQDEEGKHYTYNKFTVTTNGKTYPIKVDKVSFLEIYPQSKFRFSPRLFLGFGAGAHLYPAPSLEAVPNLQVSLFSYGKTKVSPDWTFIGLGLGYEVSKERLNALFTPFAFNFGKSLPLVDNLYLGPTIGINTSGSISGLIGIQAGL